MEERNISCPITNIALLLWNPHEQTHKQVGSFGVCRNCDNAFHESALVSVGQPSKHYVEYVGALCYNCWNNKALFSTTSQEMMSI